MAMAPSRSRTIVCDRCGRENRLPAAAEGAPGCGNCGSPLAWIADAGDDDFAAVAEQAKPFVLVDLLGHPVRSLPDGQSRAGAGRP